MTKDTIRLKRAISRIDSVRSYLSDRLTGFNDKRFKTASKPKAKARQPHQACGCKAVVGRNKFCGKHPAGPRTRYLCPDHRP